MTANPPKFPSKALFTMLFVCVLAVRPTHAALSLTLDQITDIAAFEFGGVGGLAFDPTSGELWMADGAGDLFSPGPGKTNNVVRINPLSAAPSVLFNAASGNVFLGPDAIAFDPAGELFLFSAFGDKTAGVTTPAGVAVRSLTIDPRLYAGAAFSTAGELWVADREPLTFEKDFLVQLDPLTGSPLTQVEITGASFNPNLSGLAFDPVTGNPFAYDTD